MTSFQVSAKHKVIAVPSTAQILNLFPHARELPMGGRQMAILPHGFQETVMLRNLGLDVPAPIMTQYDWPGDKRPFKVQMLTAAMMTTHQRAYVLNGMGTGKTKSTLWAYDYLAGLGMAKRALVVAPLSTLDNVWRAEAFRTVPHRSVGVLYGDKKRRLKVLAEDHDIYVINTDGLKVISDELMARRDIDTFVLDELALFRNGGSDRNKVARKLAARMTWVWGLTGSPTPTDPTDAWGQCQIVTPHSVPKFFGTFRKEVMDKVTTFKFVPKKDATEKVFNVMQPAVRFTLDDVVELPDVIERTIDIKLGKKQHEVYEAIRKHAHASVLTHDITAVNAGAALNKLLQISLGYVYSNTRGVVALDNLLRLDAMVDIINSTDRKVIVYAPFTHAIDGILKHLEKEGIHAARIDGGVSKRDRDSVFSAFQQTNKYKAIVAHPGSMSHGLTLTAADTVIWFGPTTSLEIFEQANARVRRIGQKHKQQILMLQSTSAEKRIYTRLRQKQQVQSDLLSMFAEATDDE